MCGERERCAEREIEGDWERERWVVKERDERVRDFAEICETYEWWVCVRVGVSEFYRDLWECVREICESESV